MEEKSKKSLRFEAFFMEHFVKIEGRGRERIFL